MSANPPTARPAGPGPTTTGPAGPGPTIAGPAGTGPAGTAPARSAWFQARRELAVGAGLVIALSAAVWLLLGPAPASIVALFCLAISLVAARSLIGGRSLAPAETDVYLDRPSNSFTGYWRTQSDLRDAMASMSAYDHGIRRRLQNLLAARLAEHHGISLLAEPEAAKAVFLAGGVRPELWSWIDPERSTMPDAATRTGIPVRTLTALITRLEQL